VPVMSTGNGIRHSEFKHSKTEPVHFLQICLLGDCEGLPPQYDQKTLPQSEMPGRLRADRLRDRSVSLSSSVVR
jgi:hypothetical protein